MCVRGSCTVVKETPEFYVDSPRNQGKEGNMLSSNLHNVHESKLKTAAQKASRNGPSLREYCAVAAVCDGHFHPTLRNLTKC